MWSLLGITQALLSLTAQETPLVEQPPTNLVTSPYTFTDKRPKALVTLAPFAEVTAVAQEIGLVCISKGKDDGVSEGDTFPITRGTGSQRQNIYFIIIDRADRKWSAGKVVQNTTDPVVGDVACRRSALTEDAQSHVLEYILSFEPVGREVRHRVGALVRTLSDDDIEVRESSARALEEMGGPAKVILESIEPASLDSESRARVRDILGRFQRWDLLLEKDGIERDLELLSMVDNPKAYTRLKRILASIATFADGELEEPGLGLNSRLADWWHTHKSRVTWNALLDRYELRSEAE